MQRMYFSLEQNSMYILRNCNGKILIFTDTSSLAKILEAIKQDRPAAMI